MKYLKLFESFENRHNSNCNLSSTIHPKYCFYDILPDNIKEICKDLHNIGKYLIGVSIDGMCSYGRYYNGSFSISSLNNEYDDILKYLPNIFGEFKKIGDPRIKIRVSGETYDFNHSKDWQLLKEVPSELPNSILGINLIPDLPTFKKNISDIDKLNSEKFDKSYNDYKENGGDRTKEEYRSHILISLIKKFNRNTSFGSMEREDNLDEVEKELLNDYDYKNMSQSRIQKEIDNALDNNHFALVKRIAKYLKN